MPTAADRGVPARRKLAAELADLAAEVDRVRSSAAFHAFVGVILERQRARDDRKRRSWPLYTAALHAKLGSRCGPRGRAAGCRHHRRPPIARRAAPERLSAGGA